MNLPPTVNGFWKRVLRKKTIVINQNLLDWQQEAVLCHEIGHIVCHPRYTTFSTRSISFSNTHIECEADEFAECLIAYRYDLDVLMARMFRLS